MSFTGLLSVDSQKCKFILARLKSCLVGSSSYIIWLSSIVSVRLNTEVLLMANERIFLLYMSIHETWFSGHGGKIASRESNASATYRSSPTSPF